MRPCAGHMAKKNPLGLTVGGECLVGLVSAVAEQLTSRDGAKPLSAVADPYGLVRGAMRSLGSPTGSPLALQVPL